MNTKHPSLRPTPTTDKVFMATGVESEDQKDDDELFGREDKTAEPEVIDVEDVVDEEAGQGHEHPEGAPARVLPDPGDPTDAQREDHRACGHVPYRSWCRACVEGRSTGEQHRARKVKRDFCVFTFDYLFLDAGGQVIHRGDAEEVKDADMTILVAKDTLGKAVFAHVVPQKGIDAEHYAVDVLMRDIRWLGYQRISLRSDNEPAIVKLLQHAVTEARIKMPDVEQVIEEHPNRYDSSGNGDVEAAVKSITGVLRTNKLDLEQRIGKKIPQGHPIFSWLVEYSAWILNIRNVGEDGKTAYQRVRGRAHAKRLLPFGELVLAHLPPKGPERTTGGALEPRAREGVFLGYGHLSHSYLVFVEGHVKLYRSVYRLPLSKRWSSTSLEDVTVSQQDAHQGRGARRVPLAEREPRDEDATAPAGRQARRLELRQGDFDPAMGGFGWTEHCPKCSKARMYGWKEAKNTAHSDHCRRRIEEELSKTESGRARMELIKTRHDRYAAKMGEQVMQEEQIDQHLQPEGELRLPPRPRFKFEDPDDLHGGDAPLPRRDASPPRRADPAPARQEDDVHREQGGQERADFARERADDDSDEDDDDDDFGEHGHRVPETPTAYSPTSPMSVGRSVDSDHMSAMGPMMSLLEADEELCEAVYTVEKEIMAIVMQLGGGARSYRRERARQVKALVAEVYSRPRVTKALRMMPHLSLRPGFALDITTVDENGEEWDFTKAHMREKAYEKVDRLKPYCLIGSPGCTPFSALQALNAAQYGWSPEEVERRRLAGVVHLEFVCRLYALQLKNNRYFLHEHPDTATSWREPCIANIMAHEGVGRVTADQCQYGQSDEFDNPVKKATGWMSNSPCLREALSLRCSGMHGYCSRHKGGRHRTVSGRLAREAAVYPFVLCKAILKGLQKQLRRDGLVQDHVYGIQPVWEEEVTTTTYRDFETGSLLSVSEYKHMEGVFAAHAKSTEKFVDGMTGQPLDPDLVRAARAKELRYFEEKQVWVRRHREEALRRTGKRPITVKWIDVNKGDDESPNYRSRLVAREIRRPGEDPIFAPTPPLESLRTVISMAATDFAGTKKRVRAAASEERTQISFIDISRAYFCASTDPDDPSYVELPAEDPDHETQCGLLLKHMYGTRKAADGWHCEYAGQLVKTLGFEVGDASACVFYHKARGLRCSVHGDDLTTVGEKRHLDWFRRELEKLYELKEAARLGPGDADAKEATVLNRVVRWTQAGLEYEADPRQAEKLLRDLRLDGAEVKPAATPGVKATREQVDADTPWGRIRLPLTAPWLPGPTILPPTDRNCSSRLRSAADGWPPRLNWGSVGSRDLEGLWLATADLSSCTPGRRLSGPTYTRTPTGQAVPRPARALRVAASCWEST